MLHAKTLASFLILFAACFSISTQNLPEIHAKIINAVETRDYKTAISELESLEKSDRKIFALNNYDYLLARMAEKNGDFAKATANYQVVANRHSILEGYALFHLSQIFRASGNLFLERLYLQKMLVAAPENLTASAARIRLARSFFESKDYAQLVRLLENSPADFSSQTTTTKMPNAELSRESLTLLGKAYLRLGNTDKAREIFTKLTTNLASPVQPDDFALAAAKGLDEIAVGAENLSKIAPPLSDAEYFRRAQIYQFNRDFASARLHFNQLVEKFPASSFAPNAVYQIGRGYAQERNFAEAIKWFERVQTDFPNAPIAADALNQTASAFARLNQPNEAIARYQQFIEKYPNADNLERAYLNIVDVLRDANRNDDALKWINKTRENFRGKLPEATALFAQTRIHIAQNDWTNALADLNELETKSDLGGATVAGDTNKNEVAFLKGFVLENLNQFAKAIDVYLSIPDGRNEYYGWRATLRLKALANDERTIPVSLEKFKNLREITKQNISADNARVIIQATQSCLRLFINTEVMNEIPANAASRETLLNILRQAYAVLPDYQKVPNAKLLELGRTEVLTAKRDKDSINSHQNLADELLFLGLYDEATPELQTSRQASGDKIQIENSNSKIPKSISDFDFTLAVFYKRGNWANRASVFVEPLWKNMPADYEIELIPREQIEILYPAPYIDALLQSAPSRKVDPRFLLAIMRQESRFRPNVKSNAAARGLMQFISTTSDKIAAELLRENFDQDELYNPPTAILFGSQYLADLFKIFPNQPAAVAASYNGGEDNMARWLARAKSDDPNRSVPEIAFSQSKDYVYKVMANYRMYQTLYDENLNRSK